MAEDCGLALSDGFVRRCYQPRGCDSAAAAAAIAATIAAAVAAAAGVCHAPPSPSTAGTDGGFPPPSSAAAFPAQWLSLGPRRPPRRRGSPRSAPWRPRARRPARRPHGGRAAGPATIDESLEGLVPWRGPAWCPAAVDGPAPGSPHPWEPVRCSWLPPSPAGGPGLRRVCIHAGWRTGSFSDEITKGLAAADLGHTALPATVSRLWCGGCSTRVFPVACSRPFQETPHHAPHI